METDFGGKFVYSPSFVAVAFRNGLEFCKSNFNRFNGNDLATLCKHSVNFGQVNPEFTEVTGVHPSSISSGVIVGIGSLGGDTARHCGNQHSVSSGDQ